MSTELNDYMDGDKELEELSLEARAEAEAWQRLTGELKAGEPRQAPPWMENAVMSEIALADAPKESIFDWFLRPRTIRLSPLTSLAMAAAAVLVVASLPDDGTCGAGARARSRHPDPGGVLPRSPRSHDGRCGR